MRLEHGRRLKGLREAVGLSQEQLAEAVGVSKGQVSRWENGVNSPGGEKLTQLATILRVSPNVVLGFDVPEPIAEPAIGWATIALHFANLPAERPDDVGPVGRFLADLIKPPPARGSGEGGD